MVVLVGTIWVDVVWVSALRLNLTVSTTSPHA